jgi:tetratricopeptide (TPR) repeat protein
VFGETPNVAARVQETAGPDEVVISAATHQLVAGLFVVEDRGAPVLKGVGRPVTLYRVVQPSGVRSRLDVAAGRLTPLVGREVELATLWDRWERAADSEGQAVIVVGEPGVGKSRLVYELRRRLATTPHTWLESRCTPYTAGTPFAVVVELVARGLDFAPEDTARDRTEKLARGLGLAGFPLPEAVPLVAALLGLPPPAGYPPLQMSPELQRRRTLELLAAWNLALSERQPLVLLTEDLHWCDPSSLELLGRLIEQSATARVLLVVTARPEFTSPWPSRSNLTTMHLARLTRGKAREMVASLGGRALPADVVETLVARADGVPLYLEELTKPVLEPGAAQTIEAIPATLQDSLLARLDRLSTAKDVAQRAAVLGREFSYPLLAAVAGLDEAALRQGLARLVEAEILFGRGEPPRATYTFKHALVQEAAYASLLRRTRADLHRRVVEVLEARFPERVAAEPEVAARHAEAAGLRDAAIAYFQRAGGQGQTRSAHEEAIGQFRRAIALAATAPDDAAQEANLQIGLGASLAAVRGHSHPETKAAYERARGLCDGAADPRPLAAALLGLSGFNILGGEFDRGAALAERVQALGEELGEEWLVVWGLANAGGARYWQGRFADSLALVERAVARYDAARDRATMFRLGHDPAVASLGYAGWTLCYLGRLDRALTRARDGVALARSLGDPFNLAMALFYETLVHWFRRDAATQRERAAETIALSDAQGFPMILGTASRFSCEAKCSICARRRRRSSCFTKGAAWRATFAATSAISQRRIRLTCQRRTARTWNGRRRD